MKIRQRNIFIVVIVVIVLAAVTIWLAVLPHQNTKPSTDKTSSSPASRLPSSIDLSILWSTLVNGDNNDDFTVSLDTESSAITKVEYLVDGKVVARSVEPPFTMRIPTWNLDAGKHALQAIAYDSAGNTVKSELFYFTVTAKSVEPADDNSKAMVRTSLPAAASQHTQGASSGNSSSNGNSGGSPAVSLRTTGGWWGSLPQTMQVCTKQAWNGGPSTVPSGAIVVPAGDNSSFDFSQSNKVFWFAPGEHTLGAGTYAAVQPGSGSTYIGAPGAIVDGKNINLYAFSGHATNVRVAYLEIRNFGTGNSNNNEGVINHEASDYWTMEYLYAHHNDGAAIFMGSHNTLRGSCVSDNGQYGFSMYKTPVLGDSAIKDIVIDGNEIARNNQDDWESQINGCGCTGGGKFWDVKGARVTNNYVHGNLSTGLWADTNDIDFLFDSNWIENNTGIGIWYEVSYNATITRNVLKKNAWEAGNSNLGSPAPAIYISESGGDSRLQSSTSGNATLEIAHNLIEDNFSGVSIYENSNRFCNSNGNTSKVYCTPFVTPTLIDAPYDYTYPNPINTSHPCYTQIGVSPYTEDCRWHSKKVQVHSNEFRFNDAVVPCAGTYCGVQALIATGSDNIPWAPSAYNIDNVQNDVMFNNNNKFYNNAYYGDWRFAKGYGETIYFTAWQSSPFLQDSGSTFEGALVPPPVANYLDANTATLEGSTGHWQPWYSATISQSNLYAHTGSYSLEVAVSSSGGWGVQGDNWPGFDTTPGAKRLSLWAQLGSGSAATGTFSVAWYDSSNNYISTSSIVLSGLSSSWQQYSLDVTAPANAAKAGILLTGSGSSGDTLYIDDIKIADIP